MTDTNEPFDPNAPEAKSRSTRTRKRPNAKVPTENAKRSLNLRIDDDSYKRLSVHALMRNRTISDLVMEYAQTLREYSMPHRLGAKTDLSSPADSAAQSIRNGSTRQGA